METYKCEEIVYDGRVSRIKKGSDGAGIGNTVGLSVRTVAIDGDAGCETRTMEISDSLGFTVVEV